MCGPSMTTPLLKPVSLGGSNPALPLSQQSSAAASSQQASAAGYMTSAHSAQSELAPRPRSMTGMAPIGCWNGYPGAGGHTLSPSVIVNFPTISCGAAGDYSVSTLPSAYP